LNEKDIQEFIEKVSPAPPEEDHEEMYYVEIFFHNRKKPINVHYGGSVSEQFQRCSELIQNLSKKFRHSIIANNTGDTVMTIKNKHICYARIKIVKDTLWKKLRKIKQRFKKYFPG
jgi:hypothetical protein